MALLLAALFLAPPLASAAPPSVSIHDVSWSSATPFDGKNYADAMPLGNGRVAALAWGNASTGGLELYIRSPVALHTDSQVFTIARLSVWLSPNPCAGPAPYWNQSLHLSDGAVALECGPAGGGAAVALRAFADAGADAVVVTAAAADGATPYALAAALTSVRPAERFAYQQDFTCAPSSSGPDVSHRLPAAAPWSSCCSASRNGVTRAAGLGMFGMPAIAAQSKAVRFDVRLAGAPWPPCQPQKPASGSMP